VWWMDYIVVPAVLPLGIYGLLVLIGFQKQILTRKTDRTASAP
jgi:hypothetical protein